MKALSQQLKLVVVLVVAIAAVVAVELFAVEQENIRYADQMYDASALCARWFDAVGEFKRKNDIVSDSRSATRYASLIGDEYTVQTTTLGSLEAKETAANPDFAGLMVRLFHEAGIDSGATIGITLSGSFPSLAIATLAAAQTMHLDVVMLSSLGASTYGANQPGATWIDYETYLNDHAEMTYKSALVSLGAENDNGEGLLDEGVAALRDAAARCNVTLFEPHSYQEAMQAKLSLLKKANIDLLVNIGGNQTAVGTCAHASTIPNGLHMQWRSCTHEDRGIIARLAERHVPFIHLLNIKDLASRYGMPISPGAVIAESTDLYVENRVKPAGPTISLVVIVSLLLGAKVWRHSPGRAVSAQRKVHE